MENNSTTSHKDLINLRTEIDNIDNQIIKLLDQRMNICQQVGKFKKENNISLTHKSRESDIIERLAKKSSFTEDEVLSIYERIFIISKSKQI